MSDWALLEIVIYAAGAVVALAQCAIFAHYHRALRHSHLWLWSLSFLALAVYLGTTATTLAILHEVSAVRPLRIVQSVVALVAAYCHVTLLVMGTLAIWRDRRWSRRQIGTVLAVAATVGACSALAFTWDVQYVQERLFLRIGMRHFVAAAAYLTLAAVVALHWRRLRVGEKLTAIALALYGLDLLHTLAVYALVQWLHVPTPWARYVEPLALATQMFTGYALTIWLLEDESERAEHVANAIEHLKHFDPQTGLPNRQRLLDQLGRQIETGGATLLLARIDNMGSIAAAFGVAGVEAAVATTAERIDEIARTAGLFAARPDPDHFALQGPRPSPNFDASRVAEQVLGTLAQPIVWNGRDIVAEASLGIALAPQDAQTAAALESCAEVARARARMDGPMRYRFYAARLDAEAQERLALHASLRTALLHDEFELDFQPILDARNQAVTGFEALVRWRHPQLGRLLPDRFIDELEPLGLLERLDRWVLEHACAAAREWQVRGMPPVTIAINVSARSFQRDDFADVVGDVLARTGLDPTCLEIEIVESIAFEQPERAVTSLERLRELGVCVMLDDFGTGFSSLKHLRQLPFDGIKIDRSFVIDVLVDPRDAAIVRAMLALAHSLGLDVVAEGIETAAQLAWFQSAGCDRLQGFHFHRPMSREAVAELLGNRVAHAIPRSPSPL